MAEFFDRTLESLRKGPLGPVVTWIEEHPSLAAWIVLALGMVILLVIEARDVGLLPGQWVALIVATILVAGACVWIVSWEDGPYEDTVAEADDTTGESVSETGDDSGDAGDEEESESEDDSE